MTSVSRFAFHSLEFGNKLYTYIRIPKWWKIIYTAAFFLQKCNFLEPTILLIEANYIRNAVINLKFKIINLNLNTYNSKID